MGYNLLSLTLDVVDGTKTPVSRGMAVLVPSVQLTDAADGLLVAQAPVGGQFAGGTFPQVNLFATDSPGLAPAGWAWDISFVVVPGNPAPYSFFLPAGPVSFTATDGSPCVVTISPGTSFPAGMPWNAGVQLSASFGGLVAGTTYYEVNPSGFTFNLAATPGGTPLATSASGSGTLTAVSHYLSSLTEVSDVNTMQGKMPLPAGAPSAGDAPVATGVGEASAWGTGGGGSSSALIPTAVKTSAYTASPG